MRSYRGKRVLDITVAATVLVATLPLQGALALVIRAKLGSPVLFRQQRPGLHGRPFVLLKFRTMLEPDPARGLVTDADRLTEFGRLLRTTSLDELPSLWNVLRGEMSLVGPRPLLMSYLERYSPEQARRHDVRPGITGLAQVTGRNSLEWSEKLRLDVAYVDDHSLSRDLTLLRTTLSRVLRRSGIAAEGHATMHEFLGEAGR